MDVVSSHYYLRVVRNKSSHSHHMGSFVLTFLVGGVRCERAGSYLRALSESNTGAWKDKEQPKGIYQLQGGIQKYLESYGREQSELANLKEEDDASAEGVSEKDDAEDKATNKCQTNKPCLYRGKNFVFDPRRTDPMIGNGITTDGTTTASNGEHRISLVGQCIVCSTPHDDYDNGHAPCEEKEARCCRCRVLVLVCNDCRERVRCWGEPQQSCDGGDTNNNYPDIFCGGNAGDKCVDEGNVAEKVETAKF